jgi:hypothetical protein
MNYYIAKLVFQIQVINAKRKIQYEEKLVCINASDMTYAYSRASALALKHETEFMNDNHHHLSWKFLGITDLVPMDKMEADLELYSEIKEQDEVETSTLLQRAELMLKRYATQPQQ